MFDVAAASYGQFMGRYSEQLADPFLDRVGVSAGQRVLDVGCGPGAVTARLVDRVGADHVAAVDPSRPFVEAVSARLPGVEVHRAVAEHLPFADHTFDAALAQLVVHFMDDAVAGLREMGRVTRPGGAVAASVWDYGGGRGPLSVFWGVVSTIDPEAETERNLAGARAGSLEELATEAGLADVEGGELTVTVHYESIEEWWEPYTLGVGPAGSYLAGLDWYERDAVFRGCEELLPAGPFDVAATAWCVLARAR